jgi:DNA adenine methylase
VARPFIKSAGGKTELADGIIACFPKKFDCFNEWCLGGGGLFFRCEELKLLQGKIVVLNDIDAATMHLYTAVRDAPAALHEATATLAAELAQAKNPEAFYLDQRAIWNRNQTKAARAPHRTFFLRRACFNGLWRFNLDGEFNVGWRKSTDINLPSLEDIRECSRALQHTTLLDWPVRKFDEPIARRLIRPGSLIYIDPPYDGTFTQYTPWGFSSDDQIELIKLCAKWHGLGAHVILSNSATENIQRWVREFWPAAKVLFVDARRSINSDPNGRGPVKEVVVVGSH